MYSKNSEKQTQKERNPFAFSHIITLRHIIKVVFSALYHSIVQYAIFCAKLLKTIKTLKIKKIKEKARKCIAKLR